MKNCVCEVFKSPFRSFEDLVARCELSQSSAAKELVELRVIPQSWLTIRQCKTCGSLFAEEFPFSESHGGGPACIYAIETTSVDEWIRLYEPLTPQIRRTHEDKSFLKSLGDEVGPEKCHRDSCSRLRIRNGVLCRSHHFEMIKGRVYAA